MDKKKIEEFATTARKQLIQNLTYEANRIGITPTEIQEPTTEAEDLQTFTISGITNTLYGKQIEQRNQLIEEIDNNGFEQTIEKIAYTWFNRIIAIRFMEINNYLPTHTRVLSSITPGKKEPDIITEALNIDLNYTEEEIEQIYKYKTENKTDELFKLLFIKQCNKLNEILPELFEKIDDYTEILFNIQLSNENNIINKLLETISEKDFSKVEIIGWMYQYYISERKNVVINALKSKPIKKEDIPSATQLFTPDWIVKYMVDNSLGRYWIERNNESNLINKLNYYFEEAPQDDDVKTIRANLRTNNIIVDNLKFFDSCMGSGHILVYAFDIFMEIYKELGYSEKEIPILILKNNLYGLDIDERAYQLAYFALMMKGRQYDRRFLQKDITLNIYYIKNSSLTNETINYIKNFDSTLGEYATYLNDVFKNANEFGSLIQLKPLKFENILKKIDEFLNTKKETITKYNIIKEVENFVYLVKQSQILSLKYQVIVTNPPYLNNYDKKLKEFSKKYFKDYSKDLFSMFIYRNFDFCTDDGFTAFMTPMVWMFIKNYEKLRKYIIENKSIISLIELEYHALWEIDAHVPACTFILANQNYNSKYNAMFLKLTDFTGGLEVQNKKVLESISEGFNDANKYIVKQTNFDKIPGMPIAYWTDDSLIDAFKNGKELSFYADAKKGMDTGKNSKFLRYWFEVNLNHCGYNFKNKNDAKKSGLKWFPYNKGGEFSRWVGNRDYIVNWKNDGFAIKNTKNSTIRNEKFFFKKSFGWSYVSSSIISFRYFPQGYLFDGVGCAVFSNSKYDKYIFGLLNSNVTQKILEVISPTLAYTVGSIAKIPLIINENYLEDINKLVDQNILICTENYNNYENSKDFSIHPFIKYKTNTDLNSTFITWQNFKNNEFKKLKDNENRLNMIFSKIYQINTNIRIDDKHISVTLADYEKDVKSFISYAIGCLFGRYSLDKPGINFAGGEFNINNYSKFIPDEDNIIPILDTEYFEDDIVNRFVEFIYTCFDEKTLEDNLDFISGALNKKGKVSREIIRNYFLSDFYKNHIKNYKKCPIYWQFDSGKENAFKCLIYMHRYEPDLVSRIRFDYLHKTQRAIEDNIKLQESIINESDNKSRVNKANKKKTKLIKQLDEIKLYDLALAHVANERIEIDLDDGVKVNYAKFQNIEIVDPNTNKTKKINLLKKI